MIVVADAGPLIHLAAIGQLDLIRRLSAEVLVPAAVFHEVVVVGEGLPGALEVKSATWITVVTTSRTDIIAASSRPGCIGAIGGDRGGARAAVGEQPNR